MIAKTFLTAVAAASLLAAPAVAQTGKEQNGHHYSGGPKTETIHHMGKKDTAGAAPVRKSVGHHYSGGPRAEPHHIGEKQ